MLVIFINLKSRKQKHIFHPTLHFPKAHNSQGQSLRPGAQARTAAIPPELLSVHLLHEGISRHQERGVNLRLNPPQTLQNDMQAPTSVSVLTTVPNVCPKLCNLIIQLNKIPFKSVFLLSIVFCCPSLLSKSLV